MASSTDGVTDASAPGETDLPEVLAAVRRQPFA